MSPIIIAGIIIAVGLVVAAWLISRRPSSGGMIPPQDRMELPLSTAGHPVEPSGIAVDDDTPLERGSTVLAYSQGRWWRASVVHVKTDGTIRIRYPGWDPKWDETVPREELQVDISDSRD